MQVQGRVSRSNTNLAAYGSLGNERKQLCQGNGRKPDFCDCSLLLLEMCHDLTHDPVGCYLGVCARSNRAVIICSNILAVSEHQRVLYAKRAAQRRTQRQAQATCLQRKAEASIALADLTITALVGHTTK